MDLLGVGVPEILFVLLIALILMGPRDLEKAGRTIGTFLRKVVTSEEWMLFKKTTRQLGNLPSKLMREAQEIERQAGLTDLPGPKPPAVRPREDLGVWSGSRPTVPPPAAEPSIAPPDLTPGPEKKPEAGDQS